VRDKIKTRVLWIDVLKGITVILVAIHHGVLSVGSVTFDPTIFYLLLNKIDSLGGNVRMPGFFLAAGIVMASLSANKTEWFYTKRLPVMLWIILTWTIISIFVEHLGLHLYPWSSYPLFPLGYSFPSPFGNLWFIYALLLLSAVGILIQNINRTYQILSAIGLSLLIHYYSTFFRFDLMINKLLLANLAYKGLPFFLFGFIFKEQIINFFEKKNLLITSLGIALAFSLLFYSLLLSPLTDYEKLFFRIIPGTFLFVGIIVFLSEYSGVRFIFTNIGRSSLEFFLLHQFFIAIFYKIHTYYEYNYGFLFNISFIILIPLILCLIFVKLLPNIINSFIFSVPKPLTHLLNYRRV
jgi:surface polysaccharide O-acyltransferase-like enzyme